MTLTGLNLPDGGGNKDSGVLPGRDFSAAKSVNAAQVYLDLLAYFSEYGKLKGLSAAIRPVPGNVCFR